METRTEGEDNKEEKIFFFSQTESVDQGQKISPPFQTGKKEEEREGDFFVCPFYLPASSTREKGEEKKRRTYTDWLLFFLLLQNDS